MSGYFIDVFYCTACICIPHILSEKRRIISSYFVN